MSVSRSSSSDSLVDWNTAIDQAADNAKQAAKDWTGENIPAAREVIEASSKAALETSVEGGATALKGGSYVGGEAAKVGARAYGGPLAGSVVDPVADAAVGAAQGCIDGAKPHVVREGKRAIGGSAEYLELKAQGLADSSIETIVDGGAGAAKTATSSIV